MSDQHALLAAVLAHPDDDIPRLVYADWLEEQGGDSRVARAQFIRLEIEAEKLPPGTVERARLEAEAAKRFNRFGGSWDREWLLPEELKDTYLSYRRGFVDGIRTTFVRFLHCDPTLFQSVPFSELSLYSRDRQLISVLGLFEDAGAAPEFSKVRVLQIGPGLDFSATEHLGAFLRLLYRNPTLGTLKHLSLADNHIGDGSVKLCIDLLRFSSFKDSLLKLDLSDNQLTDGSAHYLSACKVLEGLNELKLSGNRFTRRGEVLLSHRFPDIARL